MLSLNNKTILFSFTFLFVLLFFSSFASQYSLEVIPKQIGMGDTVSIEYTNTVKHSDFKIEILSPSGKLYYLAPYKKSENKDVVLFTQTYDKGFLTDNWNQYKVKLYNSKNVCIDSTNFFLKDNNKQLYFTIYIDDVGRSGYLNEEGERWFKSIGGKINYGYQHDDGGGISLEAILKRYNDKENYIFHHFHALEFSGNRVALKLDRFFKWNHRKNLVNKLITIRLRDRHYIAILCLLLILSAAIWTYQKDKFTKSIVTSVILLFILILIAVLSSHYVSNPYNWEIKLGDPEWSKKFLLNAKQEFEQNNKKYPEITRHGWNKPPRELNRFYITQMGVIADASFIYININKYRKIDIKDSGILLNQVKKYSYKWPSKIVLPLPFYTNINKEINSVWDCKEEHRGLLQIPLTFDNICAYGFDEYDRKIIDKLPNGALVSTYIHPAHDLYKLKEILTYIKENYTMSFITSIDYLKLYLKYNPRPILIDLNAKKTYWAYLEDNNIIPISECDIIEIDKGNILIHSINLPPYLGIIGGKYNLMEKEKIYKFIGTIDGNINLYGVSDLLLTKPSNCKYNNKYKYNN